MILSYVEALVPLSIAVPGVKIGLPNIAVIYALYRLGVKEACAVSLVRVFLVSLLFGNAMSLAYSVAGAVLSLAVMIPLMKSGRFGVTGTSVAGGVMHNVGQILVAIILLETGALAYYLPVLCVSGVIAGVCVGVVSSLILKRTEKK
ncbi:MAG: Gx transporter family protein [Oscillospiraceae bacterium]|nr:Gx transporter family protein [Oscillospiraceae bacterium]